MNQPEPEKTNLERSTALAGAPCSAAWNFLRDVNSEWKTTGEANEVPCHSRVIGGVLCRWWGNRPPPSGVAILDTAMPTPNDQAQPRPSACSVLLAELKRHLEITGYEARGGNWRRHRRDSILEDASAAGLRALAQLEAECERIEREATHLRTPETGTPAANQSAITEFANRNTH